MVDETDISYSLKRLSLEEENIQDVDVYKSKKFLVLSAYVEEREGETAENASMSMEEVKTSLENISSKYGIQKGAKETLLSDLPENEPLTDSFITFNPFADQDCIEQYIDATKYGVLVMAVKPEYFQQWYKCQDVQDLLSMIPTDRLFVYLEHPKKPKDTKINGYLLNFHPSIVTNDNGPCSTSVEKGKGYAIYPNADIYFGDIDQCLPNGRGLYNFITGSFYRGQFTMNRKNGTGRFKHINGNIYNGEWVDDKLHGEGRFLFSNLFSISCQPTIRNMFAKIHFNIFQCLSENGF